MLPMVLPDNLLLARCRKNDITNHNSCMVARYMGKLIISSYIANGKIFLFEVLNLSSTTVILRRVCSIFAAARFSLSKISFTPSSKQEV